MSSTLSFPPGTFLEGVSEEVGRVLRQHGIGDDSRIGRLIRDIVQGVGRRYGGQQVYVARGRTNVEANADKALELHQQGVAAALIATRFGVSQRRVYELMAIGRARAEAGLATNTRRAAVRSTQPEK